MTDCKSAPTPFLSGVKLEDVGETPLVDSTLYRQLVGSLLYLTHSRPDLSYPVGAVPGSCRSRMSYIGKLQSVVIAQFVGRV
jgi:hypothetical protein